MENTSFSISFPPKDPTSRKNTTIESNGVIVIIGANGSGKTRLGSWIEYENEPLKVHRISAQKSLTMPANSTITSLDSAQYGLLVGQSNLNNAVNNEKLYRDRSRWKSAPNTHLLNDFDALLVYLFSEEAEVSIDYRQSVINAIKTEVPIAKLDILKRIWNETIKHRELNTASGKAVTKLPDTSISYSASEMSDGERVIFYLIGQCLSVPKNAIIIIDEPEIHLHKSIQNNLWNAIEKERQDCLFIYLTHDLDFAASRMGATKIWIKKYINNSWEWDFIPKDDNIPEGIMLEILGSRKPIVFIEGTKSSLDYVIISSVFLDFTIMPCGSCSNVISITNSFNNMKDIHNLKCFGIIDRDFRTDDEVNYLTERMVFVINFSEIENILLSKDVIIELAKSMHFPDPGSILDSVINIVIEKMKTDRELLISKIITTKLQGILSRYTNTEYNIASIKSTFTELINSIDIDIIYNQVSSSIDKIISDKDYQSAIRIYNNKGLIPEISTVYGINHKQFIPQIKRLMASNVKDNIISAIRGNLPDLLKFI